MNTPQQLAKHFRDVHFGGNWTCVNLKDTLKGVSWQQATAKVQDCNTIAVLVFHIHYYVAAVLKVLQGGALEAHDKYSFDCPPLRSQSDWNSMLDKAWTDAEAFASLVEQLPESKLWEYFTEEKYGTYYRNIQGIIEHTHYHLGQISLLKKITNASGGSSA
ncbi:MAG: DUF1572 domain-containing protein [Taibaiella sp.]|nr:DUF1572 domain-containing protein [Taibaiella sp.]